MLSYIFGWIDYVRQNAINGFIAAVGITTALYVLASLMFTLFPGLCMYWGQLTGRSGALYYEAIEYNASKVVKEKKANVAEQDKENKKDKNKKDGEEKKKKIGIDIDKISGVLAPYDARIKHFNELQPGMLFITTSTKNIYAAENFKYRDYKVKHYLKYPRLKKGACLVMTDFVKTISAEKIKNFKNQKKFPYAKISAGYIKGSSISCGCSQIFWNPFEGFSLFN